MASPWTPTPRPQADRPWLGMILLAAIPLLALVLVRLLWSGSSLWFLTAGIILIGAAAVIFLARRPQDMEFDRHTVTSESARAPLILAGLGAFFLAMLVLPNFSGGGDGDGSASGNAAQQQAPAISEALGETQQPDQQVPPVDVEEPVDEPPPPSADGDTYVVQSGDNLWDIATRYDTTVDAIVEANDLANPADLDVGQELVIPGGEGAE